MRMVCVALAMQLAVLVPSPVTTVSLVLPTSLFWWVRDAVCRPCDVNCAECRDTPIFCTACTGDFPFL